MKRVLSAAAAVLAVGVAANAWGAGFFVSTHGARATGMATSVTAGIDDPSAIFFNPAGIARGEGFALQLGDTMILPGFRAELLGRTTKADKVAVFPPHLYATYGLNDMFTVGVGVFSPFGLAVHWPKDWAGRALITDSSLTTIFINPTVAAKFGMLRIGAGVDIAYASLTLENRPSIASPLGGALEGQLKLSGNSWGIGGNAGIQLDIVPKKVTLGASYRSAMKISVENGTADFSNLPAGLDTALDSSATAAVTLPQILALGLAVYPIENKLWIEFDAEYYGWQSFHDLTIHFANPLLQTESLPKNWTHIWNFHLGGEYAVTEPLRVRLGVEWDPTPSPDNTLTPDVPDADRLNLAAGLGYKMGNVSADLGYEFINFFKHRSTFPQFPASYDGVAHVLGLTLGVKL